MSYCSGNRKRFDRLHQIVRNVFYVVHLRRFPYSKTKTLCQTSTEFIKTIATLLLFSGLFYVAASCNNSPRYRFRVYIFNYPNVNPRANALAI